MRMNHNQSVESTANDFIKIEINQREFYTIFPKIIMQSTLLNRFQATMLGALIGEQIGIERSGRPRGSFGGARSGNRTVPLEDFIFFYAESLIYPERIESSNHEMFRQSLTSAEAAIALLPVFLFFHEDFAKLRKNVENVTELWQNSPISTRDLLAIGYTLSQALQERLDPRELIPQLLTATVGLPEGITHLQRLQKIDILIQQNVGLDEAVQTILTLSDTTTGDAAIALAMYCFLSTASDFRISVLRASRTGYQVPIVAALAGMLSGAYNSTIGFPLEWRLPVPHQSKISHISSQLLAQWSGIYSVGDRPESILLPVAAPQVIRKV